MSVYLERGKKVRKIFLQKEIIIRTDVFINEMINNWINAKVGGGGYIQHSNKLIKKLKQK